MRALKGVDFDVRAGEVHCLLGPNGAGKSTLIKCVSGAVAPTEGEILVDGEPLPVGEPSAAIAVGVATIYQELDLVEDLSVADSIFLGHEHAPRPAARPRRDAARDDASCSSASTTTNISPRALVRDAAPGRAAGRLDRPRAVAERAAADHGRAVLDPRRQRGRDAVRRRAAADRRRRRRRLHLAPARRDPAHRLARDGALRRAHGRDRAAGRHAAGELVEKMVGRKVDQLFPDRPEGRRRRGRCSTCAASSRAPDVRDVHPSRCARARCSASAASSAPGAPSCCG